MKPIDDSDDVTASGQGSALRVLPAAFLGKPFVSGDFVESNSGRL